ncbi:MAG: alpha-glucan family phosphorylase, partial [Actinomycetota bacterium]|nr:alpha-glucan family phosphorylase [Actinomycetota bacterium]
PRLLMERYFGGWAAECGTTVHDLMAIGLRPTELHGRAAEIDHERDDSREAGDAEERFNMAVMGLRLASRSNAVSKLHGAVSREMFADLWPDLDDDDVPITSVTNGVHAGTWVSADMGDLLSRHVLPDWDEASEASWDRILDAPDDELWRVKDQARTRLVAFVRARMRQRALEGGASSSASARADHLLDPAALTIGFARRFATYKRANLLLAQSDRLKRLLLDPDRPVQFIFAGKAHPADDEGKEMIRQIVAWAREEGVEHRFVFLDDYDIAVARTLYQGADVWLNNPRRPLEACGTSGMKAALNGTVNCSILDGWWDEMFDGRNGWAISSAESYDDLDRRDAVEADSLFEILERQVIPLYYERRGERFPREWVRRVKESLGSLGPKVMASRMVRDYVETMYEPVAARRDATSEARWARARLLAEWKQHVMAAWPGVVVVGVDAEPGTAPVDLGATREVTAEVWLGKLTAGDVDVQLIHGQVAVNDELVDTEIISMKLLEPEAKAATLTYSGRFTCDPAGRHGYTVRVIPAHPALASPVEMGCMSWA